MANIDLESIDLSGLTREQLCELRETVDRELGKWFHLKDLYIIDDTTSVYLCEFKGNYGEPVMSNIFGDEEFILPCVSRVNFRAYLEKSETKVDSNFLLRDELVSLWEPIKSKMMYEKYGVKPKEKMQVLKKSKI